MEESNLRYYFIVEAKELLESLDSNLLLLEKEKSNTDLIEEVFRIMHTLKGSAAMVEMNDVSKIAHYLENIFKLIQEDQLKVNHPIIDVTLATSDVIKEILNNPDDWKKKHLEKYNRLINDINSLTIGDPSIQIEDKDTASTAQQEPSYEPNATKKIIYINFSPLPDVYLRGVDPYMVFSDLETVGKYRATPEVDVQQEPSDELKEAFNLRWDIFLSTEFPIEDLANVFIFYDKKEFDIIVLDKKLLLDTPGFVNIISKYQPDYSKEKFAEIVSALNNAGENPNGQIITNEQEPNQSKTSSKKNTQSSIKVSPGKLDELINHISELVIINSRLIYLSNHIKNSELKKSISQVEKLSRNLRDNALELRLVPIKTFTHKFERLVRDLSIKLDKKVEMVTEGADTELDSNIIAKIQDPIMHIIRNSMDHGIEPPEERAKNAKDPRGIIRLLAFYSGSHVFIQIQDDGKGIKKSYIKNKAVEKGLIQENSDIDDEALLELIFHPGFSTAQNLSEISGRGVGMDVVKKNISDLRGTIEIDTEEGLGTSVTLKLPLTLSIIDTMMVLVSQKKYLIPTSSIESCHKIEHAEIIKSDNRQLKHNEKLLPYVYMREYFVVEEPSPKIEHLIIINFHEKKYGIIVDKVLGEHQAVVKPVGKTLSKEDFITGASILGDGSIALIIDTSNIIDAQSKVNIEP